MGGMDDGCQDWCQGAAGAGRQAEGPRSARKHISAGLAPARHQGIGQRTTEGAGERRMKNRGMGSVYQPTYTERQADGTNVTKKAATWMISFYAHGKRVREKTGSSNRSDAVRLLKQRISEVQQGR